MKVLTLLELFQHGPLRALTIGSCVPLTHHHYRMCLCVCVFISGTMRWPSFTFCIPCLSLQIQLFPEKFQLLLLENGVRNQFTGTIHALCAFYDRDILL